MMPIGDRTARPAFGTATHGTGPKAEARPSTMVAKDRPHLAPHPSPDWANDVDRAAFNAAWASEEREAEIHNQAARREAFKVTRRNAAGLNQSRSFNRAVRR